MDIKPWFSMVYVSDNTSHPTTQVNVGTMASGARVVVSEMKVLPAI